MEGVRGENFEGKNFIADARDFSNFDYEKVKNFIEEKYCFKPTIEAGESKKYLGDLARIEKKSVSKKEYSNWDVYSKQEFERCGIMKDLLSEVLKKDEQETNDFWFQNEDIFCKNFDGKGRKEEKYMLPPKKRRTYIDEELNNIKKDIGWSGEAIRLYELLKSGIGSEKIADKVFGEVLGAEALITKSEVDMNDKVDSIIFSKDVILLLQIKTKMMEFMEKNKTEIIQEVNFDAEEPEKRRFFAGSEKIKKEIENMMVSENKTKPQIKALWFTIPTQWKIGKGKGYDERLEEKVKEWCEENGIKKAKD